jgi:cytochrome b561
MPHPKGYSRNQIWLHWIMAVVIAVQFLLSDGIGEAWRAFSDGLFVPFNLLVASHVVLGFSVLALALVRVSIRLKRGAPPPPEEEHAVLKLVAQATHWIFYALMILLPISGAMAWFGEIDVAASVHEVLKTALIVLIGLHVVAALHHQFYLKNGLISRMKRPES